MIGMVIAFDVERGLGTVRCDEDGVGGGSELQFHCTAIADGTRGISEGTRVHFVSVPAHLGRMEARWLEKVPG